MTEKFTGFYTSRPFWAINAIDFNKVNISSIPSQFTMLMSEKAYETSQDLFSFQVCRDGMLLLKIHEIENRLPNHDSLDIHEIVSWWGEYLDYFNCLYLLLDSAVMKVMNLGYFDLAEVTNKDAFRITFENEKEVGASIAQESITSVYQMARYVSSYNMPPQFDPRLSMRQILPKPVFDEVAKNLEIIAQQKHLVPLLSSITKGLSEYKIGNYTTSLTLAWFVIESVLTQKWVNYLESKNQTFPDDSKRISAERKKTLTGRDYTISVISSILELSDILSFPLYKKIDTVRGYRNKVVHQDQDYICKPEHCVMALEIAKELSLEGTTLDIRLNTSFSISGA